MEDPQKLKQVRQWLEALYSPSAPPPFEVNARTVELLWQLSVKHQRRTAQHALLCKYAMERAAELQSQSILESLRLLMIFQIRSFRAHWQAQNLRTTYRLLHGRLSRISLPLVGGAGDKTLLTTLATLLELREPTLSKYEAG